MLFEGSMPGFYRICASRWFVLDGVAECIEYVWSVLGWFIENYGWLMLKLLVDDVCRNHGWPGFIDDLGKVNQWCAQDWWLRMFAQGLWLRKFHKGVPHRWPGSWRIGSSIAIADDFCGAFGWCQIYGWSLDLWNIHSGFVDDLYRIHGWLMQNLCMIYAWWLYESCMQKLWMTCAGLMDAIHKVLHITYW